MAITKLIPLVLAALLAGPIDAPIPAPAQQQWAWPLAPKPSVRRTFDPPDKPWLSGHRGVDLGPKHDAGLVTTALEVTSPADGTVTFAGVVVDRPVLTIDHGGGLRSSFEPVTSELKPGDHVAKGDVIGTVATMSGSGHCPGTCLHWGVRRGEEYINPLGLVQDLRPSILLPLD
ncbi:M23 family metallopeptidase [Paenarthrobacter sp. NPDC089714]|uniref:M23 family metallopeptidase n=1 Tax=Paenarthrobacter sp. NPDC089714 TaxID=3364377 RepID=UPI003820095A